MTDEVIYTVEDATATITLNRPESLNAMTPALMGGLRGAVENVAADQSVRVVVLTGRGRGFCSGADLSAAAQPAEDADNSDGGDLYNSALRAIYDCPVPTIARINGAAAGGGFGLALACDITVAAHSAFFVATFGPRLGIVPDMGVTWNLPLRIGRARALGLTLLGDRLSAQDAEAWGLIWRAVPDDALDDEVARIAASFKRSSPAAMTRIRESIDTAIHSTFADQLDEEMRHQAVLIPRNMQAAAEAFVEKREPKFDGNRD